MAPKATGNATPEAPEVNEALAKKVVGLRKSGLSWNEIHAQVGTTPSQVLRLRPLMKTVDAGSVRSTYDHKANGNTRKASTAKKATAKKSTARKPVTNRKKVTSKRTTRKAVTAKKAATA